MDDLSSKLTELLNDPESMNRVRQMAESILGESGEKASIPSPLPGIPDMNDIPTGEELKSIMSVISRMKSASDDSRIQLITALRPHLSD